MHQHIAIGYLTMKTLKSIGGFQLFYKKVLKQERQSIVKTNPPHLLQVRLVKTN